MIHLRRPLGASAPDGQVVWTRVLIINHDAAPSWLRADVSYPSRNLRSWFITVDRIDIE